MSILLHPIPSPNFYPWNVGFNPITAKTAVDYGYFYSMQKLFKLYWGSQMWQHLTFFLSRLSSGVCVPPPQSWCFSHLSHCLHPFLASIFNAYILQTQPIVLLNFRFPWATLYFLLVIAVKMLVTRIQESSRILIHSFDCGPDTTVTKSKDSRDIRLGCESCPW